MKERQYVITGQNSSRYRCQQRNRKSNCKKALAREGAMVIVNYNGSKERADEVVSEIEKDGGKQKPFSAMSAILIRQKKNFLAA